MAELTGSEVACIVFKRDPESGLTINKYITPDGELDKLITPGLDTLAEQPPKKMVDSETQTEKVPISDVSSDEESNQGKRKRKMPIRNKKK